MRHESAAWSAMCTQRTDRNKDISCKILFSSCAAASLPANTISDVRLSPPKKTNIKANKRVVSVLPDVAYQPSLCAVAEGGPNVGARSPNFPSQWSWRLLSIISPSWKTFSSVWNKTVNREKRTSESGGAIKRSVGDWELGDVPLFLACTQCYAKRHSINLATQ